MLQNNQTLPETLDQTALFCQMMGELSWSTLLVFVKSNAQIYKLCTLGGHRLEPKGRARIEGIIQRETQKSGLSPSSCSALFAFWYPVHAELHEALETYFHGDEYKALRTEKNLPEDTYFLTDEKFDAVFKPADAGAWKILLCFSPLSLSDEQIGRIMAAVPATAVADTQRSSAATDARVAELEKENARLKELRIRFEEEARLAQNELREARKAAREAKEANDAAQTRFNSAQADNQKLRKLLTEAETVSANEAARIEAERSRIRTELSANLERLRAESEDWKRRYESRCAEDREAERQTKAMTSRIAELQAQVGRLEQQLQAQVGFADQLLKRFNWAEIGQQLKPAPTLKRQFANLLKKLNYEERTGLSIEGSLTEFWGSLIHAEQDLIRGIAESNTSEVLDGSSKEYWNRIEEEFEDVAIGLEARLILLKLLQEIFYATIHDEALGVASLYETVIKNETK
jgi:hypothetical protein